MNLIYQQVTALDQVNFNALFEGSFPDLDENLFILAPTKGITEVKRLDIFTRLNIFFAGESQALKPNEEPFAYNVSIDGEDHFLRTGFLNRDERTWRQFWGFTRPLNGSLSFMYSPEYIQGRTQIFQENQIDWIITETSLTTMVYKRLKRNHDNGLINIVSEEVNQKGWVELKFQHL
jgi:hypothetical protein